eukprot:GHVT01095858.1.p1 GENE.GHVT01095858.1~~GHVT01095858.1.p1  ORF type:complete len:483 (+),score=95.94 GHVT01095858.1:329-1777(+)
MFLTSPLFWLLAITGFVLLAASIVILGDPDGDRLVDGLFRSLLVKPCHAVQQFILNSCGAKTLARAHDLVFYLFYTNHPLVQIFYLAVVLGGYTVFVFGGYPWLPNKYAPEYHKWLGLVLVCICLACFALASFSNPGVVTAANASEMNKVYEVDDLLFKRGNICSTCKIVKPGRSKHCLLCDRCVARFDHHCVWLANCVGAANHRLFIFFLFMHAAMCCYGAFLGVQIIRGIVDGRRLWSALYLDMHTGRRLAASWGTVWQALVAQHGLFLLITSFCFVFALALVGFFSYHLYSTVVSNITTNERCKYSQTETKARAAASNGTREEQEEEENQKEIDEDQPGCTGNITTNMRSRVRHGTDKRRPLGRNDTAPSSSSSSSLSSSSSSSSSSPSSSCSSVDAATSNRAKCSASSELVSDGFNFVCLLEKKKKSRSLYNRGLLRNIFEVFFWQAWARRRLEPTQVPPARAEHPQEKQKLKKQIIA